MALCLVRAVDILARVRCATWEAITANGPTEIEAFGALVALLEARQLGGQQESGVILIGPRLRARRDDLAPG